MDLLVGDRLVSSISEPGWAGQEQEGGYRTARPSVSMCKRGAFSRHRVESRNLLSGYLEGGSRDIKKSTQEFPYYSWCCRQILCYIWNILISGTYLCSSYKHSIEPHNSSYCGFQCLTSLWFTPTCRDLQCHGNSTSTEQLRGLTELLIFTETAEKAHSSVTPATPKNITSGALLHTACRHFNLHTLPY